MKINHNLFDKNVIDVINTFSCNGWVLYYTGRKSCYPEVFTEQLFRQVLSMPKHWSRSECAESVGALIVQVSPDVYKYLLFVIRRSEEVRNMVRSLFPDVDTLRFRPEWIECMKKLYQDHVIDGQTYFHMTHDLFGRLNQVHCSFCERFVL